MLEYELDTTLIYDLPYNKNLIKQEYRNTLFKGEEHD